MMICCIFNNKLNYMKENKIIFISCLLFIIGLSVALFITQKYWHKISHNTTTKNYSTFPYKEGVIYGIDVSHYQGSIDWQTLATKEKISFVYIRSSYGLQTDNKFATNYKGATQNGFKIGIYHFYRYWESVKAQFNVFKNLYLSHTTELIPVLDIEKNTPKLPTKIADSVALFIRLCEQELQVTPIIYSGNNFYERYLMPQFETNMKWIANYSECPAFSKTTTLFQIWQFSNKKQLCGIPEYVDMDILMNGTTLNDIQKSK